MNNEVVLFRNFIVENFAGKLLAGSHAENDKACVLEAWNAYKGLSWSDSAAAAHTWDIRLLNDMHVSDRLRVQWMPQVAAAYADCVLWSLDRQCAVVECLIVLTVQRIISKLPSFRLDIALRCRNIATIGEAAGEAAEEVVFIAVCELWLEAALEKEE